MTIEFGMSSLHRLIPRSSLRHDIGSENRPAETREYLSVPAKTILVELCQLTGTKASVLDEVEVVPLIAGPDREGGGRAAEAVDEGDEDAAGVGPEASAEMESMAGASAVAKEDPEQEEGDGRRQLAE